MITPIVMLAIRDASADMSPYVRKTAAHAIPKIYRYLYDLIVSTSYYGVVYLGKNSKCYSDTK